MRRWFLLLLLFFSLPLWAGVRGDLRQSSRLYAAKKYGQALSQYNAVLQQSPDNEQAAFGAGASAYYLKDYNTAAKAFGQVIKQDGIRTQDALFNLGNTYYRAGQKEQAIAAYRQAILKNPKDKEAIHNLQLALKEENNSNNQNNQNKNNPQDSSSNQQQGDQDNQAGDKQDPQDPQQKTPQPQEDAKNQADKEAAERVMQMARNNEQKQQSSAPSQAVAYVEEDW